jgi:putative ABC transport system permease protein
MTGMPLEGSGFGMGFTLVGNPTYTDPSQRPGAGFGMVTPDYFQTFGIRLVRGRVLSEADTASTVKVAVVNEDFVRKYLKGSDPLRQRIAVEQLIPGVTRLGPPVVWQIVGVYHNVQRRGFREENPEIEVPFSQSPWPGASIGVRTADDPGSMIGSIGAAVHAVDPQIALATPRTMEQVRDDVLANDRFTAILFASFAAVALLLAALGIYGVMAFSVTQRSHEIAVRMALGATQGRIVSLVVKEGVMLAFVGLGLGLVGAYLVGRAMRSMLFGVGAMDFSAFGAVGFLLLTSALLA